MYWPITRVPVHYLTGQYSDVRNTTPHRILVHSLVFSSEKTRRCKHSTWTRLNVPQTLTFSKDYDAKHYTMENTTRSKRLKTHEKTNLRKHHTIAKTNLRKHHAIAKTKIGKHWTILCSMAQSFSNWVFSEKVFFKFGLLHTSLFAFRHCFQNQEKSRIFSLFTLGLFHASMFSKIWFRQTSVFAILIFFRAHCFHRNFQYRRI